MHQALVTVGIVTFNSSKFVEETLESVKTQSYPNIELIISDDFSTDNTIEIVNRWLKNPENFNRFYSCQILTVDHNTGTSANCNRVFNKALGEYVKLLAGDDLLLPNCIQDNISFFTQNQEVKIAFSQVGIFNDVFVQGQFIEIKPISIPLNLMDPNFSAQQQFEILAETDRITYTPSSFFKKELVLDIGGFDEAFKLVEDYPMWLKLTGAGIKLHYFNKLTVAYRRHSNSVNHIKSNSLFAPSALNNYKVRKKYVFPKYPKLKLLAEEYEYFWIRFFHNYNLNKIQFKGLFAFLGRYSNPFWLLNRIFAKAAQKL
jgi:alpha-1,3-rhamnosyltransferase